MRVNCLRPSQVIGFDYLRLDGMLMTFLRQAATHKPLNVWRQDYRDFVYVRDVAEAFERAVQPDAPEGVFNIGSGRTFSNSEIAEAVNRAFANPHPVRLTAGDSSKKSGGFMDITRAAQELGWRPRWELSAAVMDMKNQLDRGIHRLPD